MCETDARLKRPDFIQRDLREGRCECIRTSSVCITQRSVQEDVCNAAAADVDGLCRHICEDDAVGVNTPGGCLSPDARLSVGREAQQPQH